MIPEEMFQQLNTVWNYDVNHLEVARASKKPTLIITDPEEMRRICENQPKVSKARAKYSILHQNDKAPALWDADPECEHSVIDAPGGGLKCSKCSGWFCF